MIAVEATTLSFNHIPLAVFGWIGDGHLAKQLIGVLPQEIFKRGISLVAETLGAFVGYICWS